MFLYFVGEGNLKPGLEGATFAIPIASSTDFLRNFNSDLLVYEKPSDSSLITLIANPISDLSLSFAIDLPSVII